MSIVRRTRSVVRGGVKVQRRIVLTQALFWPVVLAAGLTVAAVTVAIRRSTKRGEPRQIVADEFHGAEALAARQNSPGI